MKNIFNLILIFFSTVLLSQDIGFSDILNPVYPDKNDLNFKKNHTLTFFHMVLSLTASNHRIQHSKKSFKNRKPPRTFRTVKRKNEK